MKKAVILMAALVTGASAFAQVEQKPDKTLVLSFSAPVASEYTWRGQEMSDWTFQPSIKASYGDMYAGLWMAIPMESKGNKADWIEYDFFGGYIFTLNDSWRLDVGMTAYIYTDTPGYNPNSIEPYIGVAGLIGDPNSALCMSSSFYLYHDFEYDATTFQGSLGYSIALQRLGTSLDLSATLGWVSGNSNLRENPAPGVSNYFYWSLGVSCPFRIQEHVLLTLGVSYNDVNKNAINRNPDVIGSASVAIGF